MPRFFVPLERELAEEKIREVITRTITKQEDVIDAPEEGEEKPHWIFQAFDPWSVSEQVKKDLSKVEFDGENREVGDKPGRQDLPTGFHTLDNGLTFYGMLMGGDWEWPVFFILYWEGKRLRAYVPKEGNLWNRTNKRAYGNDPDLDDEDAKKWHQCDTTNWDYQDAPYHRERILGDIQERIKRKSLE